ncbi:MAG: hydrogenase maturation protease [Candidatus Omnitrophota bacterium]
MSKKRAVIGLGNTLRRDDGIGILVLESLLALYKRRHIDYLDFGTASFDLLFKLQGYDEVLLIDAIDAGLAPGELSIFDLSRMRADKLQGAISSHELNLKSIFELARKFKVKAKIYIAGIQARDVSHGEGLTQALAERKEAIVKEVSEFIDARFSVIGDR